MSPTFEPVRRSRIFLPSPTADELGYLEADGAAEVVVLFAWTRSRIVGVLADDRRLDLPGEFNEVRLKAPVGTDLSLDLEWLGEGPRVRETFWRAAEGWLRGTGAGAWVSVLDADVRREVEDNTVTKILARRRDLICEGRVPSELAAAHKFFLELDCNTHEDFRKAAVPGIYLDPMISGDTGAVKKDLKDGVAVRCLRPWVAFAPHVHDARVVGVLLYLQKLLRKYFPRSDREPGAGEFDPRAAGRAFLRFANGDLALSRLAGELESHAEPNSTYFLLFAELALAARTSPRADLEVWQPLEWALVAAQEVFADAYCCEPPENAPRPHPTVIDAVAMGADVKPAKPRSGQQLDELLAQPPPPALEERFATCARRVLFGVERFDDLPGGP